MSPTYDPQSGGGNIQVGTQAYSQPTYNLQPAVNVMDPAYDPVVSGGTTNTSTGGSTGSTAPVVDPYAQWGGYQNYLNLIAGYDAQKANIGTTATESAQSSANQLHSSILDYLYGTQKAQNQINESAYQNELGKRQNYASILDMINSGVAQGRTMLGRGNAANATSLEGLARAYAAVGGRQGVKGLAQYTQGQHSIANAQQDLEAQRQLGMSKLKDSQATAVNNIVLDARNKLATLDAQIAAASLPDRINIEAEKEAIKNNVLGILSQYDQYLADQNASIAPKDAAATRAQASTDFNAGALPDNPYSLQTFFPTLQQPTAENSLPIFTAPRKRTS